MNSTQRNAGTTALSGLFVILFSIVITTNCGKTIPTRDLTEARAEIEEAELVRGNEFAPEQLKSAREALKAAHQSLADENLADASAKAIQARSLAMEAREKASPPYGREQEKAVQEALGDADVAYAEVLAKDDYEQAQTLLKEGQDLFQNAESEKSSEASTEKRQEVLRKYKNANIKYAAALESALRAKNNALAQKDDLLESLAGVESLLHKAEKYNARSLTPDLYTKAEGEINLARANINEGRLKDGNTNILNAEELARSILSTILEKYARQKKEEATKAVAGADSQVGRFKLDEVPNEEARQKVERLKETLAAAREALGSAEKNFDARSYENSISDSEEAIRLSAIVGEQLPGVIRAIAGKTDRGANVQPDRTTTTTTTTATTTTTTTGKGAKGLPAGWKRYVVKKRKPADCLWRIAGFKRYFGNPWRWKRIYRVNKSKIKHPDLIYPGQVFLIPPPGYKGGEPDFSKIKEKIEEEKAEEKKAEPEKTEEQPAETKDEPAKTEEQPAEEKSEPSKTEEEKPAEEKPASEEESKPKENLEENRLDTE